MSKKTYIVNLSAGERQELEQLLTGGEMGVRKATRSRILLKSDEGWTDAAIRDALDVGTATVERVRKRFVAEGTQAINRRAPQRTYTRTLDGEAEAFLVALACSPPPPGRQAWSLRLLAEKVVLLDQVEADFVSHETVRQVLKKTNSSRGASGSG